MLDRRSHSCKRSICSLGEYTVIIGDKETILHFGNEYVIPKGTKHRRRRIAGTRTIHGFGGKRIH
jgi:hypothetical protein